MYVDQSTAEKVVRAMFSSAACLVGLICLAPPRDNLVESEIRGSDGAFIHNIELMIRRTGGIVVSSTWIGTSTSGASPCHVILAEPSSKTRRRAPPRDVVHAAPSRATDDSVPSDVHAPPGDMILTDPLSSDVERFAPNEESDDVLIG
jgi:hypothetical protein